MKVVIIEDEIPASNKLIRLLEEVNSNIEIMAVLRSVEEAVNWFTNHAKPELIFMDIQLEDGFCFEIFENYRLQIPVIFTTAYDKYTLKAFKVNSVDYLLKPIDINELRTAVNKFCELHQKPVYNQFESIIKCLKPDKKERFLVKVGEHYKSIQTSQISCFYIKERYVFIRTNEGRSYAIDYSLDQVTMLIDNELFFRINRNTMININAIDDIVAYSSNRLKVRMKNYDEADIIVSRERVNDFKKWMDR